jgi:glycosyltransferase involved in cell wall biosynthesis
MRTINIFSPVPPMHSSIADDTAGVLPMLSKRVKVILWSNEKRWCPSLGQYATVKYYDPQSPPWREICRADLSIYHIGNHSEFHGAIWRVSCLHPGLIVLHDTRLQHFFTGLVDKRQLSHQTYFAMMARFYPKLGVRLAESFWQGVTSLEQLAQSCPLTNVIFDHALGVATYSRDACSQLSRENKCPVAYVPLFVPQRAADAHAQHSGKPVRRGNAGERKGREPYQLIMFGFMGTNRRLEIFLNALQQFPQRERFRLDVYGTILQEKTVRALVTDLNLEKTVTLHGYVTDAELEAALRVSDLAINLRWPTMGEASASQLRIWHYALPSLVTESDWYATLPKNSVAFIHPRREIQEIHAHLSAFLSHPHLYREMGESGRKYLGEHHTVTAHVNALMGLIEAAIEFRRRWSTRYLPARAAAAMKPWLTESGATSSLSGAARAIHSLSARSR